MTQLSGNGRCMAHLDGFQDDKLHDFLTNLRHEGSKHIFLTRDVPRFLQAWDGQNAENMCLLLGPLYTQAECDELIPAMLEACKDWGMVLGVMLTPRERIDLKRISAKRFCPNAPSHRFDCMRGGFWHPHVGFINHSDCPATVSWVVVRGDEQPMHPKWVGDVRGQCALGGSGAAFWFAGWGEWLPVDQWDGDFFDGESIDLRHDGALFDSSGPQTSCCANCNSVECLKVGSDKSGRTLDGREYLELPKGWE